MKLIARHQCFRCNQQHEKEVIQGFEREVTMPPGWCEFSLGQGNISGELCTRCKDEVGQTLRGYTLLLFERYRNNGEHWMTMDNVEWVPKPADSPKVEPSSNGFALNDAGLPTDSDDGK